MYVVVNAAMSADGKLASRQREQLDISGPEDFDRVDQLRADSDAVMVGVGTVLADDPSLTVKDADRHAARRSRGEPENPARVVADSRIRTPPEATVLDGAAETYLLTSEAAPTDFIEQMEAAGAYVLAAGEDRVDLTTALAKLEGEGIDRLMVEGGGELIFSLFEAGLVDELRVYVGATVLGGRDAPTLADGDGFVESFPELALESVEQVDDGVLLTWTVEN
ncbi:2,5-diamino-6-(ribosylamino)-4(3H)-pyrimidinone 5'-phosphate reductase [Haloarcula laminariae]|uniref:2,5-diamino-6-(ribosylamino)-4(3H)-pyrimidinone 5'-phosphate reductase n=1 Tax=Haloarcula laminariae TaxID=2961577 RepID=UPI0021C81C58|nr:2,5-diamino-6-(ribosylamino)-4(3H)-pyrimidinone 5'-phosphate reductase [Halomicroarcula laminariae]